MKKRIKKGGEVQNVLKLFIPLVLVTYLLIIGTGCTKEKVVYSNKIVGSFFICWLYPGYQSAQLHSYPVVDTAQAKVTIEWDTNSVVFPSEYQGDLFLEFRNFSSLYPETNYTIILNSNIGSCQGTITLPGFISIIEPSYGDTFSIGQDIAIIWKKSKDADFYQYYLYFQAYDSSGNPIKSYYEDGYEIDTMHTIRATLFNVEGAIYYLVDFTVFPCSGPPPKPGVKSNMTGSIPGFLIGEGHGYWVSFYVGTPVSHKFKSLKPEIPPIKERINAYLKQLNNTQ